MRTRGGRAGRYGRTRAVANGGSRAPLPGFGAQRVQHAGAANGLADCAPPSLVGPSQRYLAPRSPSDISQIRLSIVFERSRAALLTRSLPSRSTTFRSSSTTASTSPACSSATCMSASRTFLRASLDSSSGPMPSSASASTRSTRCAPSSTRASQTMSASARASGRRPRRTSTRSWVQGACGPSSRCSATARSRRSSSVRPRPRPRFFSACSDRH